MEKEEVKRLDMALMLEMAEFGLRKNYEVNTDPDFDAIPMLFLGCESGNIVAALSVGDGENIRNVIDMMVHKEDPYIIGFLAPGWLKDPEDFETRIGECIMLTIEDREGDTALYMYEVKREKGRPPEIGTRTLSDRGSEGRLTKLFKPRNVSLQ